MSSRAMVKRLGDISDRVVRYRIKRLLDNKVLLLQANVNPQAIGYPLIADILIEVMPWKLAETCAKLAAMPPVVYASAGPAYKGRHLSIEVNARNEGELMTFVKSTLPPTRRHRGRKGDGRSAPHQGRRGVGDPPVAYRRPAVPSPQRRADTREGVADGMTNRAAICPSRSRRCGDRRRCPRS